MIMENAAARPEGRRKVTAEEALRIETVVKAALASLRAAGIDARPPRFPFSLHHEHYRVRLRRKGYTPRHADVAFLLERWAASRGEGFAESYAWQAVAGAVAHLRPAVPIPDDVAAGIASVSGGGCFEDWARQARNPEAQDAA